MAKLEQKARKGLYGGFKPGSTGGPGTGKVKNIVKRKAGELKRAIGDVASNVKEKIQDRKDEKATEELASMVPSKNPRFLQDVVTPTVVNPTVLNPIKNTAMLAGGSKPMTAMNNTQIDPVTGMPITPGGQPNMNPNFIGGINNSNLPTTNMLTQEKKMMRTLKPLVKKDIEEKPLVELKPSETYSSYKDFRGNIQKATIDDSTFVTDSIKFEAGENPNYKLDMDMSYEWNKKNNPKAVEFVERMTPQDKAMPKGAAGKGVRSLAPSVQEKMGYDPLSQQRYKIGQDKKERKSMRVKRNK